MRRFRYWLIGFAVLALLLAGSVAVYVTFIDRTYSRTEFYADTGLEPRWNGVGAVAGCDFVERPGRITFALSRGEGHGIMSTYHGWDQSLWIELPPPVNVERIEFGQADVRAAFHAFDGRRFAGVGDGGIRGHIQIVSADENRIVAAYDVTVDACYRNEDGTCLWHKDTLFRDQSMFRLRPRPEHRGVGDIWPRIGNQSLPKK